jgi:hypothetical protein
MRRQILVPILLALMALPAARGQQARKPPKRVLILDSFGRSVSFDSIAIAAFRAELTRQWLDPIDFYEIPLEAARTGEPESDRALADFVATRMAGHPFDLVVPFKAPAMRFAVRDRDRLFGETPFLIAAMDQRHMRPEILTSNTAFVVVAYELPGLIEGILQVLPRTTTITVVLGSSPVERFWRSEAQREFRSFSDRVRFRWVED